MSKKHTRRSFKLCSYPGCLEDHYARGLCIKHNRRLLIKEAQPKEFETKEIEDYVIKVAWRKLSERERIVVERFFIDKMTLRDIASLFKISTTRIQQIMVSAIKKARHPSIFKDEEFCVYLEELGFNIPSETKPLTNNKNMLSIT